MAPAMAATRRLSELLQDQQEPFLVEPAGCKPKRPRRGRGGNGGCCPVAACRRLLRLCNHGFKKRKTGLRSALSKVLGGRAMRRVPHSWEDLVGRCFSGAAGSGVSGGGDCEFRRLGRPIGDSGECDPRAMGLSDGDRVLRWKQQQDDVDMDSSRQLSPVSVLDLHSDDESPAHSPWEEEDEKPSTSFSSPPSGSFLSPSTTSPCFTYAVHDDDDKACAMEVEEADDDEAETAARNGAKSIEQQISSWEKIAGDIARIPAMMDLDLQQSARQWRERRPEVGEIGARIESLIFEDIRREAVCDMLASHCTLAMAAPTSC